MEDSLEYRAQGIENVVEGELVVSPNGAAHTRQLPMQQVATKYVTAMAVQQPRSLATIEKRLYQEAALLGEAAFYGWTVKDDRTGKTSLIGGGTINLAMVAIRIFGNCVVDQDTPTETPAAWFYPVHVIDLESGFTFTRFGRYSRKSMVYGKLDEERKERIRFEIGQSFAIRNAVFDFIPRWLINGAVQHAKGGVRKRLEEYITKNGIDKAREILLKRLADKGISNERILDKMQRATIEGLTVDDLVMMQGDAKQLEENSELAENLYPEVEVEEGKAPAGSTTEPPKTRTDQTKEQLRQRRQSVGKTPPPIVYCTMEQTDELAVLAADRGMTDALMKMLGNTDPDKVTVGQYESAKENLLNQPVLPPSEKTDPPTGEGSGDRELSLEENA